ncbi:MAG TPA: aminotransferase class I/II-fold pyridoxal phosphate-dependent enzyme [Symbiobacteriaceae bacterium]|nr:aminotransferase class I/II-fold pyridoxal phosphate-dependent enzyme [Symbiobacteriaceae bacterium]
MKVVTERGLIPFLDMAYQGFGDGIAEDGKVVRRFADAGGPLFVSNSFSKSFSLYGERVGAHPDHTQYEQVVPQAPALQGRHETGSAAQANVIDENGEAEHVHDFRHFQ